MTRPYRLVRMVMGLVIIAYASSLWASHASRSRGALLFMNYCVSCHELRYLSWKEMNADLATPPKSSLQVMPCLRISMPDLSPTWPSIGLSPADASAWFGKMPPDLSNTAVLRGTLWLKAYLLGFYPDHSRIFGVSNRLIPNVMMPNVLASFQEPRAATGVIPDVSLIAITDDIVDFLDYVAEPHRPMRYLLGGIVCVFLFIIAMLLWLRWRVL